MQEKIGYLPKGLDALLRRAGAQRIFEFVDDGLIELLQGRPLFFSFLAPGRRAWSKGKPRKRRGLKQR
jgi:hypothetical protein